MACVTKEWLKYYLTMDNLNRKFHEPACTALDSGTLDLSVPVLCILQAEAHEFTAKAFSRRARLETGD